MRFIPWDYQKYAIQFIRDTPESMVLLDMGLGKTVITLTAIQEMMEEGSDIRQVLVIAPLRVAVSTWPQEVKKWDHTAGLQLSVITGTKSQRRLALHTPADIHIINRENLPWLIGQLEEEGVSWPFDTVVIDELSGFKDSRSKRWNALWKVRPQIRRIIGLTGTPASNGLMDLWAETALIDRGKRFGTLGDYRNRYFFPIRRDPRTGTVWEWDLKDGAEEAIYGKIRDIAVSMRAVDYLEMPGRILRTLELDMKAKERRLYEAMRKNLLLECGEQTVSAAGAAILSGKLQQMANGAVYDDNRKVTLIHDRKLEALEDLIEQANGHNVLIAWYYWHDRDRILAHFRKKEKVYPQEILDAEDIADWNAGRIQVGLINPASTGYGLNLQQGGHILIWFSPVWSLELYEQTNARLWRQGQKETVTIYHLVMKDTIDEAILASLDRKATTQQALIDAVKAELRR